MVKDALRAAAEQAASDENEACAQLVNDWPSVMDQWGNPLRDMQSTLVKRDSVVEALRHRRDPKRHE